MPLHESEFQREALQGFIENLQPSRGFILSRYMPLKPVFDTKFSYNIVNGKYARTASITGFNAGAPLRDKKGLEKAFGEVAKVQHSFRMDEEELIRFNKANDDVEIQQIKEYIYDETEDLIAGLEDIEEWMRAQAIYRGRLVYNEHDINLDIDFQVPAGNKLALTGDELFSNPNAPVLDILQDRVTAYKDANNQKDPGSLHMSSRMVNNLLKNTQIKNHIYGTPTDARIVTRDQLNSLFTSLGIPNFIINDDVVNTDEGIVRLLPENRIVFMPNEELGNLMQGITVENNYRPGRYVLPEIKETNPPQQAVFAGETIFPALAKPQAVAWIDA